MKYQAVFTVIEPGQYSHTTFFGGYGGACAITPSIVVKTVKALNDLGLQNKLEAAAHEVAKGYDPRHIVSLVAVNPV